MTPPLDPQQLIAKLRRYETQEIETMPGLNGHEDWVRADELEAALASAAGGPLGIPDPTLLAADIAKDLFTSGDGWFANRLVLTSAQGDDHGGWGFKPCADRIERRLRAALRAQPSPATKEPR